MNLLLLEPHELSERGEAVIHGRRAKHVIEVLRADPRDSLRAGIVGSAIGIAHIQQVKESEVHLKFAAQGDPPVAPPVTLILALPRPKVLRRVIANVASLGIKKIVLLNAYRVEKPYWSSEQLKAESIRQACLLGLEQACDTVLPEVQMERLFKPFVQDRLPMMIRGAKAYVAHPGVGAAAPVGVSDPLVLVIGPEGGFIQYELDLLQGAGLSPIQLGARILKVETAIPYLLGRMLGDI